MKDRSAENYGNYESNRNNGNVAIKREQRLLADYAEHEQRKDCEAGLIIGNERVGRLGRLENLGSVGKISLISLNSLNSLNSHNFYSSYNSYFSYYSYPPYPQKT